MKYLAYALLSCMAWGQAISSAPLIVPACGTEAAKNSVMCSSTNPVPLPLNCRIEHFESARVTIAPQCGTNGWCEDQSLRVACEPASGTLTLHGDTLPYLKPEPMDVPAIKESKRVIVALRNICDAPPQGKNWCSESELDRRPIYGDKDVWTCKKGSHRILLQDVDGDFHCIKFSSGAKD